MTPGRTGSYYLVAAVMAVVVALPSFAFAEEENRHTSGFGVALGYLQIRDENVMTALLHGGPVVGGELFHDVSNEKASHRVTLSLLYGDITNRFGLPALAVVTDLRYRYLRTLPGIVFFSGDATFLGFTLAHGSTINHYPYTDEGHLYWLTATSLGVAGGWSKTTESGGLLRLDLAAPLVALVSRPPEERFYNNDHLDAGYIIGKVHEDPSFRSVNSHLAFDAELSYSHPSGKNWDADYGYRFRFIYDTDPRDYTYLTHSLFVRFGFSWGAL